MKKILCSGLVLAFSIFWASLTNTRAADIIDFETDSIGIPLPAGTKINQVFGAGGNGPIDVTVSGTPTNQAIIFDSNCPPGGVPGDCSGGDDDLGTPNAASGGPGRIGAAGAASNTVELGNILIIAEDLVDGDGDGLVDDPDDADIPGSKITFDFSTLGVPGTGVTISSITYVEVENSEAGATVLLSDGSTSIIPLPVTLDNGVKTVNLGPTSGVNIMEVNINGSGGIDNIVFNFCGDGEVDPGEQCDDGNNVDGDGCSAICETEAVCSLELVKTATPVPPPGICKGGITEITFEYTGDACNASTNLQEGKFKCSPENDAPGAGPVSLVLTGKDADKATVSPDSGIISGSPGTLVTITATGDKLKADTKFDIQDSIVQSLSIHMSCSKDIAPGDQFGSLKVVSFTSKDGGFVGGPVVSGDTEFTYKVTLTETDPPDTDVVVTVTDDQLGFIGSTTLNTSSPEDAMVTFTQFGNIQGTLNEGRAVGLIGGVLSCEATATPPPPPPAACEDGKKVKAITFEYTGLGCSASNNTQPTPKKAECTGGAGGTTPVDIAATDKKNKKVYADVMDIFVGNTFMVDAANAGNSKLDSEINVDIDNGLEENRIHTSCSQPLAVDDVFGSLIVRELILINK